MNLFSRLLLILAILQLIVVSVLGKLGSPEQVGLNYGSTPSEMVATWAITSGSLTDGRVEYGTSATALTNIAYATATTYSARTYSSPTLYKATMTGLEAGNAWYYYRVGSPSAGYSTVYKFKSNPGVNATGVTFHIMGDPGQTENSLATFQELLTKEHSLTGPSGGIINMGDLSYANSIQSKWDDFGKFREFVASEVPMFSTVGNHEWFEELYSFDAYLHRFDNPLVNGKRELYYSFDIGLVHWVMVAGYCEDSKSSGNMPCLNEGTAQRAWLLKDLASVDRSVTPWLFVVFHQPYINSNTHHDIESEGQSMQVAIEDILYNAKVDIVFSGHVHAYERSCQVYKYACTEGAPYYVTVGDGGNAEGLATPWVTPQPAWSLYRQASYGFGELTVVNATHSLWQWHQNEDLDPVIADTFWYVKGSSSSLRASPRTGEPSFVKGPRGERAALINKERTAEVSK